MSVREAILLLMLVSGVLGCAGFYFWLSQKESEMQQATVTVMHEVYDMLQQQIDLSRKLRHDLAKHIQTLEFLLQQDPENTQIRTYIGEVKLKVKKSLEEKYCKDEIINAILATEQRRCLEKGIPIKINVEQEEYDLFSEFDKVGLLCNLLDNAMEANERIPEDSLAKGYTEKEIIFSMGKEDGKLYVFVENAVASGEKITFRTHKKNTNEHGIGTKIIGQIVKKYNGTKQFTYDAGMHRVRQKIVFPVE